MTKWRVFWWHFKVKFQAWVQEMICDTAMIIERVIKVVTLQLFNPDYRLVLFGFKLSNLLFRGKWL